MAAVSMSLSGTDMLALATMSSLGLYGWIWAIDQWDDGDFIP